MRAAPDSSGRFVYDLSSNKCIPDLSGQLEPEKWRVLALAFERSRLDLPVGVWIEDAHVRLGAGSEISAREPKHARGLGRDAREREWQRDFFLLRPLEC